MRDIIFLGLLPLMLYAMARRPFIALGMWIWTAMFFPNAWMYGLGASIRYNVLFTIVAIGGYVLAKNKPKAMFGSLGLLIFLFFAWTTLSAAMTEGVPDVAWEYWYRFVKTVLLFVFVVLIVDKKLHIDFFLWCVVLSIGFYGGLEALKYIASGGGHHIEGFAGHVLGDRNELALSFVMTLPICFYLLQQYGAKHLAIRYGLLGLMCLLVTAIIGTQSRGGFVALIALGAYFFIKSDRKILLSIIVIVLAVGLSTMVSQEWVSRMDTIGDANEDASFMGRVVAWKMSFIMAAHHPFFGGGFKAIENPVVWADLTRYFLSYSYFYSGDALPIATFPRAAHSVYFQVLGDHGFFGLGLYVAFLLRGFMLARKVALAARKHLATAWIAKLATMLQLSLFTFAMGGAALSFAYFELVYAIFGMLIVLDTRILPRAIKQIAMDQAQALQAAPAVAAT